MDKLQTLDNIKRYGIINSFFTLFFVVLTTYIDNIYLEIASALSMIFWILFIKNVSIFYDHKSLNRLNIVATIALIVSMTSINILLKQIPQGSEDVLYEPTNQELLLVLSLSIVMIASIVMFMIVMYKLAKITKSKIFFYCFWLFNIFGLLLILSTVFEYGEIFEHETVYMLVTIAMTGLFLYGVIKFYDENKKLHVKD